MRTFIAIRCPEETKKHLEGIQKEISDIGDLRMVKPENIHLTLRFIGEVDDALVPQIIKALEEIKIQPFSITITGVDAFPSQKSPRVIWAGVGQGSKELSDLHVRIDTILERLGIEKDERFTCHYTIARVKYAKDKEKLAKVIEKHKDKVFDSYTVDGMDLMKSKLTPNGPLYSVVKTFRFTP